MLFRCTEYSVAVQFGAPVRTTWSPTLKVVAVTPVCWSRCRLNHSAPYFRTTPVESFAVKYTHECGLRNSMETMSPSSVTDLLSSYSFANEWCAYAVEATRIDPRARTNSLCFIADSLLESTRCGSSGKAFSP